MTRAATLAIIGAMLALAVAVRVALAWAADTMDTEGWWG